MPSPSLPVRRSAYADRLRDFAFVLDDQAVFDRRAHWHAFFRERIPRFSGQIIFDIGCADADYLARIAANHPTAAFIGLDWKHRKIFEAALRIQSASLNNVALLRGRAQDLGRMCADGEVDEMWVFHPEPCDREVELPNRLIRESFLLDTHRVLSRPEARLCIKTDHPGYYQWILSLLGLPAPAWFSEAAAPGAPRIRRKDLMRPADLPGRSDAVRRAFEVGINSADFWQDLPRSKALQSRLFGQEPTRYEARYLKRRLPIYYLELVMR